MITLIAAISTNNALGKDNDLIWRLPADLKRFKKVTSGHHILMGRNTFESIGKPLPNRTSVIITRNNNYKKEGCLIAYSLEEAIAFTEGKDAFIIGGAQVYKQALENNLIDQLDITRVHQEFEADVFFPEIDDKYWKESKTVYNDKDEMDSGEHEITGELYNIYKCSYCHDNSDIVKIKTTWSCKQFFDEIESCNIGVKMYPKVNTYQKFD